MERIDDRMLSHIENMGAYFREQLEFLMAKYPEFIVGVRGKGLLLGAELSGKADAHAVQDELLKKGFVIGTAGGNTLRFAPPYIIMQKQIGLLIETLDRLFQ